MSEKDDKIKIKNYRLFNCYLIVFNCKFNVFIAKL